VGLKCILSRNVLASGLVRPPHSQ